MPKERQRSILGGFGGPLRALWGPLLGMLEGLWLFLGIVWVQNGARNVKMRVYLAQVEVARGSQRLSGFDFERIFITCCVLCGVFVCFLVSKVLCMQCGTLTWTIDMFSFISALHFSIVAASHCSLQLLFSISFGRGQGSAAGAAEDHMTCILDA